MKLKDLLSEKIKVVSFSELGKYDNWDAKFWVGMNDYIEQHKKLGKDKAVEFVANRVKKIGEENYNTLKNIADKNHFGVPEFKNASDVTKLNLMGSEKIVVLMDLVQAKAAARKSELEKRLKEMQKQIALLGESTDLVESKDDWLNFKVGDKVTPINKYFRGNKDYQEFWSGAEIIDMGINDQDITIQVEKNGKKSRNVQKAFKFKLLK